MVNILIKKLFFKFLKQDKILNTYINNAQEYCLKNRNKTLIHYINDTINEGHPEELVNYTLEWRKTYEGFYFWYELDDKWRDIVDKLNEMIEENLVEENYDEC